MISRTRNEFTRPFSIACLCALAIVSQPARGATGSARQQVRAGLEQHLAGEYEAAAESFAAAEKSLPGEPRIAYDRACALAAQGRREQATDLFQQAALAREPQLAVAAHYNLGCLVAQQAKELFGDKPEQADAEIREQGVKLLHEAVMHYRDCLRIDVNHERARKNLELLRLWIKHMDDAWARRDRDKRREEMDLLQFLEWIEGEQRTLEAATKALGQIDGSPRQRQAIAATEDSQRLLADEIEPLQQKLEAAVADEPPALQALTQMAHQAKGSMFRAADDLKLRELPTAFAAQGQAIESLNEIYRAVAPFEQILQKATAREQSMVDTATSIVDELADESLVDRELVARDQHYIAGWSETLPPRAQQGLAQLEQASVAQPGAAPPDEQKKQQQIQAAMQESYKKAIELAPRIVELASAAAADLSEGKWTQARPKQEEALRLLKEIAPKTPPDQQQQDQQDDERQDKQDDNKDQQPDKGDQQKDPQNQQQDEQQGTQKERQKALSRQQAEALLSKARQREREHRERRKVQLRALQGAYQVDRDW